MKDIDMHCDTVTECFDRGYALANGNLQVNSDKLKRAECAAQCFAIFTQGEGAARRFYGCIEFYKEELKRSGLKPVLSYADLEDCISGKKTGSILTVENLGFTGDLEELYALSEMGVKMASLVWNFENSLAYPNLIFENGLPNFSRRESRGLKDRGRRAVEILDGLKIIIDISHLSDGGAEEILKGRKIPVVASHSNAEEICGVSRNLTDGLIKKTADCGGVIGVNFCKDFLGEGDNFELVYAHIRHLIKVGGEEVIAFGSDFDGIPVPEKLETCTAMPALISYLEERGIRGETLEKLCYKNFARVLKEVCG